MKRNINLLSSLLILALIFSYGKVTAQSSENVTAGGKWKTAGNALVGGEVLGSTNNFDLNIVTDNVQRMIVKGNNGNVGINTLSPNALLHVNSLAGTNPFRVQVAGATKLYVDNGGGVSVGSSAIPPANGLFVSGNAGIGTSSPVVKLHVTGGTDVELGSGGFIVSGPTTGLNLAMDDNEIMVRNNGVASTLFLNNEGGDVNVSAGALVVDAATNNVGIGIAAPTSKLHVVGNIFATGNVDVSGTVGFGSVETISDGGSNTIQSNSNIVPDADGSWNVGTATRTWASMHALVYLTSTPFGGNAKIQNLDAGIKEIMKLRPVSYTDGDMQKYALVGKEVQQVLPQVTRDWEITGDEATQKMVKKSVDVSLEYDAIIPVLIKGMQDQQNIIATLEERIATLESALNSSGTDQMKSGSNVLTGVTLEQNQPNPFNQSTIIRYHLQQGTSGVINIYAEGGILVRSFKTNDSGQVTINGSDLKAGTYTYTLNVNGKMAASKKLVLVK